MGKQADEEEEEEEAAESLLFTVATCSSRGSHSEIWTPFLWFFLVFSVWVLPVESWVVGFLGDGLFHVSIFYALAWSDGYTHVRQSMRHVHGFFLWWFSTALCLWQSLVRRSSVEYSIVDFSWR